MCAVRKGVCAFPLVNSQRSCTLCNFRFGLYKILISEFYKDVHDKWVQTNRGSNCLQKMVVLVCHPPNIEHQPPMAGRALKCWWAGTFFSGGEKSFYGVYKWKMMIGEWWGRLVVVSTHIMQAWSAVVTIRRPAKRSSFPMYSVLVYVCGVGKGGMSSLQLHCYKPTEVITSSSLRLSARCWK